VEKNISATHPITCGRVNPDIFESDDVKSVSSLSPNNKPIWRHNVEGEHSKFPATISLYGASSEDSAEEPWVLEWIRKHRIRVDGRIRFEYAMCGRGNFWIRKEKVSDSKYPDTCRQGLSNTIFIRNSRICVSFRCFSRLTLKCTYHLQRTLFKPFATLFVCVVCMLAPVLGTDTSRALFCQYFPLISSLERDVLGFTDRLLKTATKSSEETISLCNKTGFGIPRIRR